MKHAQFTRGYSIFLLIAAAGIAIVVAISPRLSFAQAESEARSTNVSVVYADVLSSAHSAFKNAPSSGQVIRGFGGNTDAAGTRAFHSGLDYLPGEDGAIFASAAGHVSRVEANAQNYGNVIEIDHGNGLFSRYAHISGFEVRLGDDVVSGQTIGHIVHAQTPPTSQAPHLHFEVFSLRLHPGQPYFIDPQRILNPNDQSDPDYEALARALPQ